MKMPRFFEVFQVGALGVLAFLGLTRVIWMSARGARVLVVDRQRTGWQMLADAVMAGCLLVWAYEIVAYGWPLGFNIAPLLLGRTVVDGLALKTLGAAIVGIGLLLYAVALHHLGTSWRLGLDRKAPGPFVTSGIYGWLRHPIYLGFDFLFVGTFLVLGRLIFLLLALVMAVLLDDVMRREERFLTQLHGDVYRDYARHVGRYCFRKRRESEPHVA